MIDSTNSAELNRRRNERLSPERRSEIARTAASKRWARLQARAFDAGYSDEAVDNFDAKLEDFVVTFTEALKGRRSLSIRQVELAKKILPILLDSIVTRDDVENEVG